MENRQNGQLVILAQIACEVFQKRPPLKQVFSSSRALLPLCYGRRMPRPPLPQIYCNVHFKPRAVEAFTEQGLKCIQISDTSKYKDRDEKDFIGEMYAEGKLFSIGDLAITEYVQVELRPALEGCEVGDALCIHATPPR